ncbi:hypothetical protein BKI52_21455 [marine bacterium AO1-C]|nr:hypothetical protein BKI52_21455 [marine bacterium AO1-C]
MGWVLLLLLCSNIQIAYAQKVQTKNYLYQAAFIKGVTKHVDWPTNFKPDNKFKIGVLGNSYAYGWIQKLLTNKKIKGLEVEVLHFRRESQVVPCHILFVSASNNLKLGRVFFRLLNTPVLVISEQKDLFKKDKNELNRNGLLLAKNSGINLKIVNKQLRFDLNKENIRDRKLTLVSEKTDYTKPSLETLENYDQNLKKVQKSDSAVTSKIARIKIEVDKKQQALESSKNKVKSLQDSLMLLLEQESNNRNRIAQTNQSIQKTDKEIAFLTQNEDQKRLEEKKLAAQIARLKQTIKDEQGRIENDKSRVADLKQQIAGIVGELKVTSKNAYNLSIAKFLYEELKKTGVNANEVLRKIKGYETLEEEFNKNPEKFNAIKEKYRADTLEARKRQDSLIAMQALEKKNQETALKQKELELQQQKSEIQQHRATRIIALLVGLILLIFLLFFFLSSRRRKKTIAQLNAYNTELNKNKQEIEEKNVVLQQNIVELKKKKELEIANQKLEEANQKLDQLQKYKEKLTNMIVHDLKNPLGAVLVNSKMAFDHYAIDPKIKKRLQDIHYASKRIKVYIEDMLAIQTFANSELPLHLMVQQVRKGVQTAINILRSAIKEKSLIVENNIPKDYYAEYDSKYIGRVFENLLSNAIKYTDTGGKIVFSADLVPGNEQAPLGYVHFAIADSGTGIPEDKFKEIFEPFMQLEAREFANTSSTGIGLTFCKMAVESHKSHIVVTSEVGVGTTFAFDLPRVEPPTTKATNGVVPEKQEEELQIAEDDSSIALSDEERKALQPLVQELDKVEFYEVSTLLNILKRLEQEDSPSLSQWKTAVEESIDNFNEIEYKKLKSLV